MHDIRTQSLTRLLLDLADRAGEQGAHAGGGLGGGGRLRLVGAGFRDAAAQALLDGVGLGPRSQVAVQIGLADRQLAGRTHVLEIDPAAGEHDDAGGEVHGRDAVLDEDLEVRGLPQDDDAGGGADRDLLRVVQQVARRRAGGAPLLIRRLLRGLLLGALERVVVGLPGQVRAVVAVDQRGEVEGSRRLVGLCC